MTPDLPNPDLIFQQAAWLAPIRARLLRQVAIARRQRVLDLGAGYGAVTGELVRRSGGLVIALDRSRTALSHNVALFDGAGRVGGVAERLPLAAGSIGLVFCQVVLMWFSPAETLKEIWRVLQPGGVLVAIEPDFGGLIEHPPQVATQHLWITALHRAGADPLIGRKLPGLLVQQGFEIKVDLLPELMPPSPLRFTLLRGLPLSRHEQQTLDTIEAEAVSETGDWAQIAHLPFVLAMGTKR
jgi:SAM-dependent methyltransferase